MKTLMTSTDMIRAFQIAKIALEDRDCYDLIVSKIEISDDELAKLYDTICGFIDGDWRAE